MRYFLSALLFTLIFCGAVQAQNSDIQWAKDVLDVSSEWGRNTTTVRLKKIGKTTENLVGPFSAAQALGAPNALPKGGESPVAWTTGNTPREEFIKVSFERPTKVRTVLIAETLNPGSVSKIYGYSSLEQKDKDAKLLKELTVGPTGQPGILKVDVDADFDVAAIKIVLDGKTITAPKAIDAIGISGQANATFEPKVAVHNNPIFSGKPDRLPGTVNTSYHDIVPVISPDGKRLYFGRRNHPANIGGAEDRVDVWYSEKVDGQWQEAVNAGAPFNNKDFNFISAISADGKKVILGNVYVNDTEQTSGVSESDWDGSAWSFPKKLEIPEFSNSDKEYNFNLSKSGNILLMSIDKATGFGARDLYVSFKSGDSWSAPKNLGPTINTGSHETTPFLSDDEKTLFFSSSGHPGFGKEDIFVAVRQDDTWEKWSTPENLGQHINSANSDMYFYIQADGSNAYFVSGESSGNADIFNLVLFDPNALVTLKGRVLNKRTGAPLLADLVIEREDGTEAATTVSNAETGEYSVQIPAGFKYNIVAKAKRLNVATNQFEFLPLVQDDAVIEIPKATASTPKEYNKDVLMAPIEENPVELIVEFDFAQATLRPKSRADLDAKLKQLQQFPNTKIRLEGHTDSVGGDVANQRLSERRANAVMQYLIQNGLDPKRVRALGFGESRPIATNDTAEGRQRNRRTELYVEE